MHLHISIPFKVSLSFFMYMKIIIYPNVGRAFFGSMIQLRWYVDFWAGFTSASHARTDLWPCSSLYVLRVSSTSDTLFLLTNRTFIQSPIVHKIPKWNIHANLDAISYFVGTQCLTSGMPLVHCIFTILLPVLQPVFHRHHSVLEFS